MAKYVKILSTVFKKFAKWMSFVMVLKDDLTIRYGVSVQCGAVCTLIPQ